MSSPVFLSDSVYFHFGTASATTGAAVNADSTPTVTVAEDGVDMGYTPSVSNVTTGLYIVTIAATAGNGFEAGKRYSVYATATVGGIVGRDGIAEFEVLAVDLNTGVASVTGAVGSVTGITSSDIGAIKTKTDFLPSATAGAAGGVFIAGANATTSIGGLTTNITGNLSGSVGSVTGLTAANLDVAVSTRLASASYTAPDNASIATILTRTDVATSTRMASFTLPTNFSSFSISASGGVTLATTDLTTVRKVLINAQKTDPATGLRTVYDDDSVTPLYTANVYNDAAGTILFNGTAGINKTDKLS